MSSKKTLSFDKFSLFFQVKRKRGAQNLQYQLTNQIANRVAIGNAHKKPSLSKMVLANVWRKLCIFWWKKSISHPKTPYAPDWLIILNAIWSKNPVWPRLQRPAPQAPEVVPVAPPETEVMLPTWERLVNVLWLIPINSYQLRPKLWSQFLLSNLHVH